MWVRSAIAAAVLVLASRVVAHAAPVDCEPARCAAQTALDKECPCDQATNHGRHVSCVAHVVNRLSRDGTIPTNCKGKIRRCAARSICGKAGFVTCHFATDTCDPVALTCTSDSTVTCATDLDCGSVCRIRSSSDLCTAAGGVVGAGGTCCADCSASTP
jgi:hypothetical protein